MTPTIMAGDQTEVKDPWPVLKKVVAILDEPVPKADLGRGMLKYRGFVNRLTVIHSHMENPRMIENPTIDGNRLEQRLDPQNGSGSWP